MRAHHREQHLIHELSDIDEDTGRALHERK
jgi:hypothetical protein